MHIIKLCVGVSSVEELLEWRAERKAMGLGRPDGLNVHRTRMTPKRADEIAGHGSLYWVIAGTIRCRQRIVGFESSTDAEGRPQCHILLDPEVVRTMPYPRRPFQGWRYLEAKDAPPDLAGRGGEEPPADMAEELAQLGLI
ncbi:DUF1489 family protein [Pelagibacterium limicola]|uniref:DUF1489 family protein n=1 Tax=Pelagibacterium limicola TaxID=2791022 RepID=UPI0018AFA066|nr:DUF1489 domain-containing protein [Pelagibacterium limicola]